MSASIKPLIAGATTSGWRLLHKTLNTSVAESLTTTDVITYTMPGGTMGTTSMLRIRLLGEATASNPSLFITFDGTTLRTQANFAADTLMQALIWNDDSLAAQNQTVDATWQWNSAGTILGTPLTKDTSGDIEITAMATTAAGETATIHFFTVEILD